MKTASLLIFLFPVTGNVFCQTYNTYQQGGNNNSGGNYVAPVVTKTYTMPTMSTTPYTPPAYNPSSSGSSGSTYTPSYGSGSSSKTSSEPARKTLTYDEQQALKIAELSTMSLFCSSCPVYGADELIDKIGPYQKNYDMEGMVEFVSKNVNPDLEKLTNNDFTLLYLMLENALINTKQNEKLTELREKYEASYHEKSAAMKQYDETGTYYEGLARVKKNGKYGFIDIKGNPVSAMDYDWVDEFDPPCFGNLTRAYKEGAGYGMIDNKGNIIIPLIYDGCEKHFSQHDGLAWFEKDKKAGAINYKGEVVIPFIYDEVLKPFYYSKSKVKLNGEVFFINPEGNKVEE